MLGIKFIFQWNIVFYHIARISILGKIEYLIVHCSFRLSTSLCLMCRLPIQKLVRKFLQRGRGSSGKSWENCEQTAQKPREKRVRVSRSMTRICVLALINNKSNKACFMSSESPAPNTELCFCFCYILFYFAFRPWFVRAESEREIRVKQFTHAF